MSLEAILEESYDVVMRANESEIAAVPSLLAMQTTAQDEDGNPVPKDIEKMPLPSITITAMQMEEMSPNSGVFRMQLDVECVDAAVRKTGTALRLDEILRHAARPRLYKDLVAMITLAGAGRENFKCYGLPERGEFGKIEFGEGMVKRGVTIQFICSSEETDNPIEFMQLPSWTFSSLAGAGLFTTDHAAIASTNLIVLSQTVLGAYSQGWSIMLPDTEMVLTNPAGVCSKFRITSITEDSTPGNIDIAVAFQFSAETNWAGRYAVSFIPASV